MTIAVTAAVATTLVGVVTDVRARRIPNALTFGSAACAVLYHAFSGTPLTALLGWVVGVLLFLPVFMLRGMGAGDVKLLAAIGAWVGPSVALWTALYTAMAGGVLALAVASRHRYCVRMFQNVWLLLATWRVAGVRPVAGLTLESSRSPRLPYAIPISAGLVVALWLQ